VIERLLPIVEANAGAVERAGEALLIYTADAGALMEKIYASGVPVENTMYRQAGLEDVFLRLTGRQLID
jgi:lipooligosaccharide transport system ATP-binding protein